PCAFISGITGQFFRQFAVTIAVSTCFSAFNSLTLSPALASILLRQRKHGFDWMTLAVFFVVGAFVPAYLRLSHDLGESWPWWRFLLVTGAFGGSINAILFLVFNRVFDFGTMVYTFGVKTIVRLSIVVLVVYGGFLYATYWYAEKIPKGFIPV